MAISMRESSDVKQRAMRVMSLVPLRVAWGHLLTGRELSAEHAYRSGMINEVVPAGQLDACVDGWVRDLLRAAPLSVRSIKQAAAESAHLSIEAAFAKTYEWEERRRGSLDSVEEPKAFAEKRVPTWRGV